MRKCENNGPGESQKSESQAIEKRWEQCNWKEWTFDKKKCSLLFHVDQQRHAAKNQRRKQNENNWNENPLSAWRQMTDSYPQMEWKNMEHELWPLRICCLRVTTMHVHLQSIDSYSHYITLSLAPASSLPMNRPFVCHNSFFLPTSVLFSAIDWLNQMLAGILNI